MSGAADRPDTGPARRKRRRVWLVPVVACAAGAALLQLAVPYLNAAFIQLPGDPVMRVIARGHTPNPHDFEKLVRSRRQASAWVESAAGWFEIPLGGPSRPRDGGAAAAGHDTKPGRALLDGAAAAFDRGLARSPGNSIAWMELAKARLLRAGASPEAAAALHMSMRTAPFLFRAMIERLHLSLLAWPYLDDAARRAVERQVGMVQRNRWLAPRLEKLARRPDVGNVLAPLIERITAAAKRRRRRG